MVLLHLFNGNQARLADFAYPTMQMEQTERSKRGIVASHETGRWDLGLKSHPKDWRSWNRTCDPSICRLVPFSLTFGHSSCKREHGRFNCIQNKEENTYKTTLFLHSYGNFNLSVQNFDIVNELVENGFTTVAAVSFKNRSESLLTYWLFQFRPKT